MHAISIKGGWVGQTFALAKRNESEGRKSRIRRSKDERKEMVESFIKKYQKSNKGNFPSLNLTHKEVGGSFYTVREIVRDIIQENRVLGPAKFNMEEQSSDQFLEQDPLVSIARDPQTYLVTSSNENYLEPNDLHDTSEEVLLDSDGQYTGTEHQMVDNGPQIINGSQLERNNLHDKGEEVLLDSDGQYTGTEHQMIDNGLQIINGSQVEVANKESTEVTGPELQVRDRFALKQNVEQQLATSMAKITPVTADVIVETFPLRPVTRTINVTEEGLGEVIKLDNSLEKKMEVLDLKQGKYRSDIDGVELIKNSNSSDERSVDDVGNMVSAKKSCFGGEKEEKTLGDRLVQSTELSTHTKDFDHKFEGCTDPQVVVTHQSVLTSETIEQSHIDGAEVTGVQDGFDTKSLTNSYTGESKATKEVQKNASDQKANSQGGFEKRSNPALDRTNLESWDGAPKNSVKPEANPLLAIFRAFANAFVKFWSE